MFLILGLNDGIGREFLYCYPGILKHQHVSALVSGGEDMRVLSGIGGEM